MGESFCPDPKELKTAAWKRNSMKYFNSGSTEHWESANLSNNESSGKKRARHARKH